MTAKARGERANVRGPDISTLPDLGVPRQRLAEWPLPVPARRPIVPTVRERVTRVRHALALIQGSALADQEAILDVGDLQDAIAEASGQALVELYWLLNNADPKALDAEAPTDDQQYQIQRFEESHGGDGRKGA